jgi:putative membrane protein
MILKYNNKLYYISLFLLIIISIACLIGLNTKYQDQLVALTPYLLIFAAVVVLINHREWHRYFTILFVITCLTGFLVELVGIETGLIFGHYTYGDTLGYKLYGVPVISGLNWFLMVYSCGMVASVFKYGAFIRSLIGATLMVIIDFSLEPVAVILDYWSWQNDIIPLQNYIGWFVVAFFLQMYFQQLELKKTNRIAVALFIIQFIFFFVLSYTL